MHRVDNDISPVTEGNIERMPIELLEAKITAFNRIINDEGIYFPYRSETHSSHARKVDVAQSLIEDIKRMWHKVYLNPDTGYKQDTYGSDKSELKKALRIAREEMGTNEYEQLESFSNKITELEEMLEMFQKVIREDGAGTLNTGLSKREKQNSIIQIAFTYGIGCFNDDDRGLVVNGKNLKYEFLDTHCIKQYRDVVVEKQEELKEDEGGEDV